MGYLSPFNLPNDLINLLPQSLLPGNDLGNLGVQHRDVDLFPGVLSLHMGGNRKIVLLPGDLLQAGQVGEMGFLPPGDKGIHDASDVVRRKFIIVRHLDALFGGVDEEGLAVGLVLLQHHDAGGNAGAEKQIAGQLDDAVDEVVVHQILADLFLGAAPVEYPGEAYDGRRAVGCQPCQAVHDKRQVRLALGGQHPRRGKPRVVDEGGIVAARPLDGVGRIGDDQLKRFVVPVLRVGQGVLAGNVELVVADVMQKHVDAAEVVGGDVDFLPVKAHPDPLRAQHLHRFEQKRTGTAGRVYVPTDFDTIEKAFSGAKAAEKGLK